MGEIPEWLKPYCKPNAYTPTEEDIESLEPQSRDEMLLKFLVNSVNVDLSDYYTKSEVDSLIDIIPKFDIKVVQTLPTTDISPTTVYLVPSQSESSDIYKEYIYVNDNWELIGIQKADLSNYYNKTEVDNLLDNKATTALYTATLPASGWTNAAPFTQTVSVSGILSTDTPIADVVLDQSIPTALTQIEAWMSVSKIETADGTITATCLEEKPTINIPIQLKVVR